MENNHRLRCTTTPCDNLVLPECPNTQCHMHCNGCTHHSSETKTNSRVSLTKCVDGQVCYWFSQLNTRAKCNMDPHPSCIFGKCETHCADYNYKTGKCYHPDLFASPEIFLSSMEEQKQQLMKEKSLLCKVEDCGCQVPVLCKNVMCSDHCSGCDVHKAKTKQKIKPPTKLPPFIVKPSLCMGVPNCVHEVTRECNFVMCSEHCPGCHVHIKEINRQIKKNVSGQIDDSLHRAVKEGNSSLVDKLLHKGADIYGLDIHENSPVYYACLVGNSHLLKLFFNQKYQYHLDLGSVEGQRCWLSAQNQEIRDILKRKCSNATDKKKSFFNGCFRGKLEAVKAAEQDGLNVNLRDTNGYNGLDISVLCGNTQVASYLEQITLPSLLLEMRKLVNSQIFTDMKIQVQGQIVHAHKAIVVARLPLWKSLFQLENNALYKILPAFEYLKPQTLVHLMEFLYTGTAFFNAEQLQALGVVAKDLQLEYLIEWCARFKMKQIASFLPPDPNIILDLKTMLQDHSNCDIILNVQGHKVPAHKYMLIRSEYFRAMFSGNMMEASMNEIDMSDISHEIFLKGLEFLYSSTMSIENISPEEVIELLCLSAKWLLKSLTYFCDELLCSFSIDKENAKEIQEIASMYQATHLYKKCLQVLNK